MSDEPNLWSLFYAGHPWSLNDERTWHRMQRHRVVKVWREAYRELAREARIPRLAAITVTATPFGVQQDVANCFPAAKAAIDGLCDTHEVRSVIPNDRPEHVVRITFMPPRLHDPKRKLGLELIIARFTRPED